MYIIKEKKVYIIVILLILAVLLFYKKEVIDEIKYVDRKSGQIMTEKVPGEGWLKWLYYNPIGKLTTSTLVKNKFLSEMYGNMMDKPDSKEKIEEFVKNFDIDLNESAKQEFNSFNDFFVRKLNKDARPIAEGDQVLTSPADGKVLYFEDLSKVENFFVKGSNFDLKRFVKKTEWYDKYKDGAMMIIRLAPADYHRYHFPVSGTAGQEYRIKGDYYSVSPYAVKGNIEIYFENKRSLTEIKTDNFGDVIMAEVGATMVGGIIQTYTEDAHVYKGAEKGYFKFGGSTVILLLEKGKVEVDADIAENSRNGLETKINMGEKIGHAKK